MSTAPIKIEFDTEAMEKFRASMEQIRESIQQNLAGFARLNVQPWQIDTPQGPLVSWLDDRNQVRHTAPDYAAPDSWRRLYVERKA